MAFMRCANEVNDCLCSSYFINKNNNNACGDADDDDGGGGGDDEEGSEVSWRSLGAMVTVHPS